MRCAFFAVRIAFLLTFIEVGDTLVVDFPSPAGVLHVPADTAKCSPK